MSDGLVFLVDKSALARIERHAAVEEALLELDSRGTLATCDVVDLEVGYSARSYDEYQRIWAAREVLYRTLPITPDVTRRARQVQRALAGRAQHRGAGIADLLIAACAEVHGAVVVHYDADYELISAATGQRVQWIVPRGSAD